MPVGWDRRPCFQRRKQAQETHNLPKSHGQWWSRAPIFPSVWEAPWIPVPVPQLPASCPHTAHLGPACVLPPVGLDSEKEKASSAAPCPPCGS